ncbi:adenylosuccinate lyase [Patescibacteria group bacterium]|nr:adenylosuccinate lyase [Patescibacteria group bacterium]
MPLDRYMLSPMEKLWGRARSKFEFWLKVELAVLQARGHLGEVSLEAYVDIKRNAKVNVNRIKALEAEFDHDMIAFVVSIQESLERAGVGQWKGEFHKPLTSYDIEDPATILMLREAVNLILEELVQLEKALRNKAAEHQWTLMIARTHGQDAEPSTFGHLLLVFAEAVYRSIRRLEHVINEELSEGKISGAVGMYGGISPVLEEKALAYLGLKSAKAETQILQRDRHAAVLGALAVAAGTIEQMASTFWQMMRSNVGELREPRRQSQRGSSAMAWKRNPILTERLIGLARLIRGWAGAQMESIATPEWRDIAQSIVERHTFPDATTLMHYAAVRMTVCVERLEVFPDKMQRNLDRTCGVWAGQLVQVALTETGVSYEDAYLYIQQVGFDAVDQEISILQLLCERPISKEDQRTAESILGQERLEALFDPMAYIRPGIEHIFIEERSG